jgi:hypothetical protein
VGALEPEFLEPQRWCIIAVILSAAGFAVSLVLARIQALAFAGAGPSFCSLGETVDYDRVVRA